MQFQSPSISNPNTRCLFPRHAQTISDWPLWLLLLSPPCLHITPTLFSTHDNMLADFSLPPFTVVFCSWRQTHIWHCTRGWMGVWPTNCRSSCWIAARLWVTVSLLGFDVVIFCSDFEESRSTDECTFLNMCNCVVRRERNDNIYSVVILRWTHQKNPNFQNWETEHLHCNRHLWKHEGL